MRPSDLQAWLMYHPLEQDVLSDKLHELGLGKIVLKCVLSPIAVGMDSVQAELLNPSRADGSTSYSLDCSVLNGRGMGIFKSTKAGINLFMNKEVSCWVFNLSPNVYNFVYQSQ